MLIRKCMTCRKFEGIKLYRRGFWLSFWLNLCKWEETSGLCQRCLDIVRAKINKKKELDVLSKLMYRAKKKLIKDKARQKALKRYQQEQKRIYFRNYEEKNFSGRDIARGE